ncbi:unnamed protein product [Spirodela intermedia]|uniref:Uncharacterized protein n=1 Tax=Spirodela intermedia TaxID=51605 RepID=A0A7I8IPI0_SPIIN|nr:unnamed protein product [Spirodela intermedia]CAA6659681.1 unnamed protein product [Spirodela intermedia]
MGVKILSLQMFTWCFHMMMGGGATTTCQDPEAGAAASGHGGGGEGRRSDAHRGGVKLIRADGGVEVYHRAVSASELMSEHPRHLLCRSDAFTIGQRIPAIPEEEVLQPGEAYFLLPCTFPVRPLLRAVRRAEDPLGEAADQGLRGLSRRSKEVEDRAGGGRVCTTAALEKDYWQLVAGGKARQWKPKLETITESEMGRGKLVFVVAGAMALVGIRRRRDPHQGQGDQRNRHRKQQQDPDQKTRISAIAHHLNPYRERRKQKQTISVVAHHLNPPPRTIHGKQTAVCNL